MELTKTGTGTITKTITITYIIMKRLLNLLLTLLIVTAATAATAATVNRQQAREAAAKFMQLKGKQIDATSQQGNKAPAADQPLYVFNAANDGGFVVVSGDDRTDAILGYTTQGSYDEDNLPPALKEWLSQMTIEIEALQQLPAEGRAESRLPRQEVALHAPIPPLIATTWSQGNTYLNQDGIYKNNNTDGIYNIYCPLIGENFTCTGCVATAGAQIMYYHRCPKGNTEVLPGYLSNLTATSNSLESTVFQWDNMKTNYNETDAGSDAAKAVAELMLYAGWAANMQYGIDGSSSDQNTLVGNMVKYFDYDSNWQSLKRNNYSVAEWDEIIYNELANKRPIIYDGHSDANEGHAFICDGYDNEGRYHFNWGWGGLHDGFFKLQATNPYNDGRRSGFIFGCSAIVGIQPINESPSVTYDIVATAMNPMLKNETTISMMLQNANNREYGFGLGIAELKSDGGLTVLDNTYEDWENSILPPGSWWEEHFEFDLSQYTFDEGCHIIVPVSKLNGEWKRCIPSCLYYEVIVSGGETTVVQHPTVNLSANNFVVTGNTFPGTTLPVTVTVNNSADDYTSSLYLFASLNDNKGSYVYVSGSAIPANGSENVCFYFTPNVTGTWNLWVATDPEGQNCIGDGTVSIGEAPSGTVNLNQVDGELTFENGGKATYTMTVENVGDVPYYNKFISHLWTPVDGNLWGYSSENDTYSQDFVIVPGDKVTASLTFEGLIDGESYCIDPQYCTTYGGNTWQMFKTNWWDIEFTYTAPAVEPDPDPVPGDTDGDGLLTAEDVTPLIEYLTGKRSELPANADLNEDTKVDIIDIVTLISKIIELQSQD